MEMKKIRELAKILNDRQLTHIEYSSGSDKIVLKREPLNVSAAIQPPQTQVNVAESIAVNPEAPAKCADTINSPMVGVFYAAPSPESQAFVKAGDKVKKGDILCIIEAMKLMNEIAAEKDCEIIRVLTENAQIVEYGQPLFEVR